MVLYFQEIYNRNVNNSLCKKTFFQYTFAQVCPFTETSFKQAEIKKKCVVRNKMNRDYKRFFFSSDILLNFSLMGVIWHLVFLFYSWNCTDTQKAWNVSKILWKEEALRTTVIPTPSLISIPRMLVLEIWKMVFSLNFELTWNEKCDLFLFKFKTKPKTK